METQLGPGGSAVSGWTLLDIKNQMFYCFSTERNNQQDIESIFNFNQSYLSKEQMCHMYDPTQ